MKNQFKPTQHEISDVTAESRRDARRGTLAGGLGGYLAGALLKKKAAKIAGAVAGGVTGHMIGSRVGRREGAKDVLKSRQALLQNMDARLDALEQRDLDRNGNDFPGTSGQHPVRSYPHAKGPYVPGDGIDDQEAYEMSPLRQKLTAKYGVGIVSGLDDSELSEENCRALMGQVLRRQSKASGPFASTQTDPDFERGVMTTHLGANVVDAMSPAEVRCHFLSAQRRGLIELDGAEAEAEFAILDRERTAQGTFAPEGQVTDQAVARAYDPRARRTGISEGLRAAGVAAGLGTAIAHARKLRKAKLPRLTAGIPTLPGANFARADDGQKGHGLRDAAIAGTAVAGLTGAALLAARRLRRGRMPRLKSGTSALPARTSPPTYDVETQVMSRRLPLLTQLAMGHPGKYPIKRRALRGKKPPTGIHPRQLGKAKKHSLAFLIADDAPEFRLTPQAPQRLPAGVKRRVPLARSRKEVLARLKAMTQLSRRDFGAGSLAAGLADGVLDALAVGGATNPTKRKKLVLDKDGNPINPQFLPDPGTTSTSSFASAIARLHEFGFGSAATSGVLRDAGVIAGADLTAEELHDAITKAQKRKKQKALLKGGIEATPGMNGAPTSMSAIHGTLSEFSDDSRDRAKRRAGELGATGAGAAAGALAGAYHDQGEPVRARDLRPGDQVYRRQGPGGIYQHTGVVGEDGNIVHRSRGSSVARSVKPGSFVKGGRGPLRRETHPDDLPRAQSARNASKAAGTRQGVYSTLGENCQKASTRIASKGAPVSRQLRKTVGGAILGGAAVGAMAHILQNRKNRGNQ